MLTKKEVSAVMTLLGAAECAVNDMKNYMRDYDVHGLCGTVSSLENAVKNSQKVFYGKH